MRCREQFDEDQSIFDKKGENVKKIGIGYMYIVIISMCNCNSKNVCELVFSLSIKTTSLITTLLSRMIFPN